MTERRIMVSGHWQTWSDERVARERESARAFHANQSTKDIDEAWMSQWAAGQSMRLVDLAEEILANPTGEREVVLHHDQPVRSFTTKYGTLYACREPGCAWKAGSSVVHNFIDGRGRRDLAAEGCVVATEEYARGIGMMASNYSYMIVDVDWATEPGPTAAEAGLGR